MADGSGEGGQDICTFFASFINQRQQVERLLNWLRDSQTACTDSNCFDDINGLPGTEQGANLLSSDNSDYYQADDHGPFAMVMCLLLGLLTIYAMSLNNNRQGGASQAVKSTMSRDRGPPSGGDDHDDNNRPSI